MRFLKAAALIFLTVLIFGVIGFDLYLFFSNQALKKRGSRLPVLTTPTPTPTPILTEKLTVTGVVKGGLELDPPRCSLGSTFLESDGGALLLVDAADLVVKNYEGPGKRYKALAGQRVTLAGDKYPPLEECESGGKASCNCQEFLVVEKIISLSAPQLFKGQFLPDCTADGECLEAFKDSEGKVYLLDYLPANFPQPPPFNSTLEFEGLLEDSEAKTIKDQTFAGTVLLVNLKTTAP